MNFGNAVIEIPLPKFPARAKKKTNCGNAIAEIGKKRKFFLVIVAMALPKMGGEKKLNGIVAMSLPKMEGKKKLLLPKSGEEFKKKIATSTIFLQHFHNKSEVINYY